jgi:hypothetical protein
MLPIRANAGTVVNENNPEDARALLAYYNREQYPAPESPFYGSYYSDYFAAAGPDQDGKPKYEKNQKLGRYEIVNNYEGCYSRTQSKSHWPSPKNVESIFGRKLHEVLRSIRLFYKTRIPRNTELRKAVMNLKREVLKEKLKLLNT